MSLQIYTLAFEANQMQNGWTTQMQLSVYDYPDHAAGTVLFFERGSLVRGTIVAHPTYEYDEAKTINGIRVSGTGVFGPPGTPGIPVHFHIYAWKNVVMGIKTMWIQTDVFDVDGVQVWGTGPIWPASESTPIRLSNLTFNIPK